MADTPHVVYIHGAGRQENRDLLKRRLDGALFGANQLDRTVLAYYSHLLHDEPELPGALEAADAVAAADITAAFFERASEVAEAEAVGVPQAAGAPGEPVPLAGKSFPDPAFFLLAGLASTDVIAYLVGRKGPSIRQEVLDAIPPDGPLVVVAHSLGTIVAYDVLAALDRDVRLLVTLGSPLGIGNVQSRIGDRSGPPSPIPACVRAWRNFADPFDPVALERTLADEFTPHGVIVDTAVDNPALLNHDLTGYLGAADVRAAIGAALA